jgi:DNA-binding transcriptional ArsR family regulator
MYIFVTELLHIIMRRDVFQAIADPTRREILGILANRPLNLNSVAEKFDVSRPAISKHIKILTECGLITVRVDGRDHYCEAKLNKLSEVSDWIEQYRKFWEDKLDSLEKYLQMLQLPSKNKNAKKTKKK